jgi:BRCT domain type II-containing protein
MARRSCDGWVSSLNGQIVCFTGKTILMNGQWKYRRECIERAERVGALCKSDFSRKITLVVYGDLTTQAVIDLRRHYSEKLLRAEEERERGHHVCVVDADGFSDLLRHRPAPCLELRLTQA